MRSVLLLFLSGALLGVGGLLGVGFLLDVPTTFPPRADAIVVISGDEQLARFREGVRLFRLGWARYIVFSGAAQDGQTSNAAVMRALAIEQGVPAEAILEDHHGVDTWGNAVHTRRLVEEQDVKSVILVTSPYHLRRALVTFEAAYEGTGVEVWTHAAPDSQWRKLGWWQAEETRRLTRSELEKLAYIALTGKYN